jgi:peptidyl-prolyl cis-trans isomerase D
MLTSFRRLSKSSIGTGLIALVGLLILIGFALGDIQSLSIGTSGLSSNDLAKAGSFEVTDRDMSSAMQRRLAQVRQQNPEADYSTLAGDFDPLLDSLIDGKALQAFAQKYGFVLSKRLIDGEIANIPGVKGLGGQVSTQGYQAFLARERLTDAEVRDLISISMLQRLLITPAASNARIPIGVATPYASMLLEARQGEALMVPIEPFKAGLDPTEAQIQQFYMQNRTRYMVPEQRVLRLAPIGPDQVANIQASDQEIAAYYNAHQDVYGTKDIRTISQAVVPDPNVAKQIADRARSGQSFIDAVKPAGLTAADITVGPQTKAQFTDLASAKVAAAAFSAKPGEVVGPIQSDLGWHVIKIDAIKSQPGKSLADARGEIATQLTADKRKNALADIVNKVQDLLDGGSNFDEAAKKANLAVTTTPPITATGVARGDASYKFPADLAPALKTGFDIAPTDEPAVEQLADDKGFVLVAPAQVIPSAPAPLASIRDQVRSDWIQRQATDKAKAVTDAIAAKAAGNISLADAAKQANVTLPAVQPVQARRIQLTQMGPNVPPPLRTLFTTGQGKTQSGTVPPGFYVVKVNKIIPGNALNQPGLITEIQKEFSEPLAQEYAQQFQQAAKLDVGVRRNEPVIEATKRRITSPAS